ncbi:MAG: hypothetical protein ACREWG_09245, partial [Gammaproteobacteria bacterium]
MLTVARHAELGVPRRGLGKENLRPRAVAGAGAVEQHPGVEPAGLGVLQAMGEFVGLAQGGGEVGLG